ncbi:hypothetical protein D920_01568 [Enterococcus faecalis 13-SD-W-01]|nr:hypothetical protein D920_01568 [Enterococcus faecalis 13-SD-W-01]
MTSLQNLQKILFYLSNYLKIVEQTDDSSMTFGKKTSKMRKIVCRNRMFLYYTLRSLL